MNLSHDQIKSLEEYVARLMGEREVPGLALGIAKGDKVVYKKGFGVRDLETKAPVTTKTIFGVASVSKSFAGVALMKLCEEGKMSVHDPVKKHLPEFGVPGNSGDGITCHHCLTHSAGFPPLPALGWGITDNTRKDDLVKAKSGKKSRPPVTTYSQLIGYLRSGDFLMFGEPGKYYSYSNDAYGVLGAVIEKVSGDMYARYVEQNVLAPLSMKRSTFNLEEILKDDDVTTLYYRKQYEDDEDEDEKENGDKILSSSNWQMAPAHMACGFLKSCVDDLLNYVRWHASGGQFGGARVLSKEGLDMMVSPYMECSRDSKYGYGLRIQKDYHGVTLVSHSGGLKGVSSQIGWVKDEGISVVVLSNLSGAPSSKVLSAAFNLMLGLPLETPLSPYKKDDWCKEELEGLKGTFKSGEGGRSTFFVEDGKLMVRYGRTDKEIYEVRRDRKNLGVVTVKGQDNEIGFLKDSDRKLWAIRSGGRIVRRSS